jgi:hypothetical protein
VKLAPVMLLFALPTLAQITVTCPAPGTVAVVSGIGPCIGGCYVRVEPNPDNKQEPHKFPAPGFDITKDQVGPVTIGTATFTAMSPGPWLAYYFQNEPYVQSKTVATFTCAEAIVGLPPPPTTPSPVPIPRGDQSGVCYCQPAPGCSCSMVLPRLTIYVGLVEQQPNGTWRIHGDPPMSANVNWQVGMILSVNGLIAGQDEFSVEFDSSVKAGVEGQPLVITPTKAWPATARVEARWFLNYTGQ